MLTTDQNSAGHKPTYLIVMREVLIAQDLSLTIADHDPGATVILASNTQEAEGALAGIPELILAFIVEGPKKFRESALADAIAARGGRAVLLGDDAETAGPTPDWDVLYRPFSTDQVLAKLADQRRPRMGAA